MGDLKISVITVCYNTKATIAACIQSVSEQTYSQIEHIIIDGASTDGTLDIIMQLTTSKTILVSEPDKGIYDAINKGIALATGDVVGVLNADDTFASHDVLANIAVGFINNSCAILYGNLDYVNLNGDIVREWRSGEYKPGLFNWGWMPPHPTFYCKRELFDEFGNYRLDFGTAADYELMLRYIHLKQSPVYYLNQILVKMKIGGVSNSSYMNRFAALYYDLKAMYNNKVYFPPAAIIFKPLRKINQFR